MPPQSKKPPQKTSTNGVQKPLRPSIGCIYNTIGFCFLIRWRLMEVGWFYWGSNTFWKFILQTTLSIWNFWLRFVRTCPDDPIVSKRRLLWRRLTSVTLWGPHVSGYPHPAVCSPINTLPGSLAPPCKVSTKASEGCGRRNGRSGRERKTGTFFRISVSLIFCCVIPKQKARLTDDRIVSEQASPPLNGSQRRWRRRKRFIIVVVAWNSSCNNTNTV